MSKAIVDGWWVVSGANHVEIVVAETETLAIDMFTQMLRLKPPIENGSVKPLEGLPQAGTDVICNLNGALTRCSCQIVPDWIDRCQAARDAAFVEKSESPVVANPVI